MLDGAIISAYVAKLNIEVISNVCAFFLEEISVTLTICRHFQKACRGFYLANCHIA